MEEILGLTIEEYQWQPSGEVPMYIIGMYQLKKVCIMDTDLIFMIPLTDMGTENTIKKHIRKVENIYGCLAAIRTKSVSNYRRKSMIESRIQFVTDSQVFLPFLGTILRSQYDYRQEVLETFTVSTQIAAIKWLLNPSREIRILSLMDGLGYTAMTASRVARQLEATGCFDIKREGQANILIARYGAMDTYERIKPYMTTPVCSSGYAELPVTLDYVVSGTEAVAKMTMLNPDNLHTYAVFGAGDIKLQHELVSPERQAYVEIWKYNPSLLSKEQGVADPVSVALSLDGIADERVEGAIEDMLEQALK